MTTCLECRYFLPLFIQEITRAQYYSTNIILDRVQGACVCPINGYHGPIRFFLNPLKIAICQNFLSGSFSETTGNICPKCKIGNVLHTRTIINMKFYTRFICSNKECKSEFSQIPSVGKCKKCKTPLVIYFNNGLRCECPNCGTGAFLPFMIHEWPAVSPTDECTHSINSCQLCAESIKLRKPLIEVKLSDQSYFSRLGIPVSPEIIRTDQEIPEDLYIKYRKRTFDPTEFIGITYVNEYKDRMSGEEFYKQNSQNIVKWDFN